MSRGRPGTDVDALPMRAQILNRGQEQRSEEVLDAGGESVNGGRICRDDGAD